MNASPATQARTVAWPGWKYRLALSAILVWFGCIAPVWGCYTVVVGEKASADGSILVGHNEQNGGRRILNFRRIPRQRFEEGATQQLRRGGQFPQPKETYSFLWSENPGLEYSDTYFNEWGVAVMSDGCPTREDGYDELVARGEIRDGGIGYMLRRCVAQRARTAREGVRLAGTLVERFGYVDSGRTYVIADPEEVWLLAVVRGRRWIAHRAPDDAVVLLPNVHIIGEVDLQKSASVLASPDIVSYAIRRGWFGPSGREPFNFRAVYRAQRGDPPDPRQFRGQEIVTGQRTAWPPERPLPFAVKPARKMTVADVIEVLRDHRGTPNICTPTTQEAAVFQLRSDVPRDVGCVYWRTTAEPCISALTPWYAGITETPKSYYRQTAMETQLCLPHHFSPPAGTFALDPELAWWKFKALQEAVHEDYENRIEDVRRVWKGFEDRIFDEQRTVVKRALEALETDRDAARAYLTRYCAGLAAQVCREADQLAEKWRRLGNDAK